MGCIDCVFFLFSRIAMTFSLRFAALMMALVIFAGPAHAVVYTIDSSLSSLTLKAFSDLLGELDGQGLDPLGGGADDPASLTSFLEGTISATLVGSTLTFSGGSDIDVLPNVNANFIPTEGVAIDLSEDEVPAGAPDGIFTFGEDNFGFQQDLFGLIFAAAAFRDIAFDIMTGTAELGGGGATTGLTLDMISGFVAAEATSLLAPQEHDLIGNSGLNVNSTLGWSLVGNLETISIPINIEMADDSFDLEITGTIVATRVIPEPNSLVLLGCGIAGLLATRRSRASMKNCPDGYRQVA